MPLETKEQKQLNILKKKNETFLKSCGMSDEEYTIEEAFDILLTDKATILLDSFDFVNIVPTFSLKVFTLKNNNISDGEQRREIDKILKICYAFKRKNSYTGNAKIRVVLVNKKASENYRKYMKLI